jgi:hypothetical protein
MPDKQDPTNGDLSSKVAKWLHSEGYPLEFRAANIMRSSGFRARQGEYVRRRDQDGAREVDVVASMHQSSEDGVVIRISQVVECKWSKDKPWVIFVSPSAHISSSACAAQSIGSEYGVAVKWAIAGDQLITEMNLFSSPIAPGFNGRQAFSNKGNDHFYDSMKSVTDKSTALVTEYDRSKRKSGSLPRTCVVAFPIILVDGKIFGSLF